MSKRNIRLVVLMVLQIVAIFFMIFRGIQKPWEMTVTGGLIGGAATTCAFFYVPPKTSRGADR